MTRVTGSQFSEKETVTDAEGSRDVWNSKEVIDSYASDDKLQGAERAVLEQLSDRLSGMHMLDIGVGGGRTTAHFASRVAEYVGVDYAENMIEACKRRFSGQAGNVRFEVMNAKHMPALPDKHFDLVLFSYNGLDYVTQDERVNVFQEVLRVGKPGGYFLFSTHNIRYLPRMYELKWHSNWRTLLYQFYRTAMLYRHNGRPSSYKRRESAIIRDGAERFAITTCYVDPEFQIRQLSELGFQRIQTLSVKTGNEIPAAQLGSTQKDAWIYYFCQF